MNYEDLAKRESNPVFFRKDWGQGEAGSKIVVLPSLCTNAIPVPALYVQMVSSPNLLKQVLLRCSGFSPAFKTGKKGFRTPMKSIQRDYLGLSLAVSLNKSFFSFKNLMSHIEHPHFPHDGKGEE